MRDINTLCDINMYELELCKSFFRKKNTCYFIKRISIRNKCLYNFSTSHLLLITNIVINSKRHFFFFSMKKRHQRRSRKMQIIFFSPDSTLYEQPLTCRIYILHLGNTSRMYFNTARIAAFGMALLSRVSESGGNKECRAKIASR